MKDEPCPVYIDKANKKIYRVQRRAMGLYRVMAYDLSEPDLKPAKASELHRRKEKATQDLQRLAFESEAPSRKKLTRLTGMTCRSCEHYDLQTWTCMDSCASGLPPFNSCANWTPGEAAYYSKKG